MSVLLDGREIQLEARIRIKKLLQQLDIYPEEVLVLVNGKLSTEDRFVEPEDTVEIVRIISSG